MCGVLLSALVLVEVFGFQHTLWFAAAGNFIIALTAICLARERRNETAAPVPVAEKEPPQPAAFVPTGHRFMIPWILFSTGFCAMAMEIVWVRAFTPVLKTQVYSFALIVFTYLGATFLGSLAYRHELRKNHTAPLAKLFSIIVVAVFLPVVANDSRIWMVGDIWKGTPDLIKSLILLGSICPFCALLGYLTPSLIDQYAQGKPEPTGRAYSINIIGCILGPVSASYCLLPYLSERYVLIVLALPFLAFWLAFCKPLPRSQRALVGFASGAVLIWSACFNQDLEIAMQKETNHSAVRRDYAATVISYGERRNRGLMVNGISMTGLTPITKFMAHLPLAFHDGRHNPRWSFALAWGRLSVRP